MEDGPMTDLVGLAFILPIHLMSATAKARFRREPGPKQNHSQNKKATGFDYCEAETQRQTSILFSETNRNRATERSGWLSAFGRLLVGCGLAAVVIVLIEIFS